MTDLDEPLFEPTLQNLLRASDEAARVIEQRGDEVPDRICHHFVGDVDVFSEGNHAFYEPLTHEFREMGLDWLSDRLEAWETARPDPASLNLRVGKLYDFAQESRLSYQGWSWEPRNRSIVSAASFGMLDHRRLS